MNLSDYVFRKVPRYYDTMYLDGFTPEEILFAKSRDMQESYEQLRNSQRLAELERAAEMNANYNVSFNTKVEVKK